jgi:hypothetical protein
MEFAGFTRIHPNFKYGACQGLCNRYRRLKFQFPLCVFFFSWPIDMKTAVKIPFRARFRAACKLAQEIAYLYARASDDIVIFTRGALSIRIGMILLPSVASSLISCSSSSESGSRIVTKRVSWGVSYDLRCIFHLAVHNVL